MHERAFDYSIAVLTELGSRLELRGHISTAPRSMSGVGKWNWHQQILRQAQVLFAECGAIPG